MAAKQGPRKVGPKIVLTKEFKRRNYTEVIQRMRANGIVSETTAEAMLIRVDVVTRG